MTREGRLIVIRLDLDFGVLLFCSFPAVRLFSSMIMEVFFMVCTQAKGFYLLVCSGLSACCHQVSSQISESSRRGCHCPIHEFLWMW